MDHVVYVDAKADEMNKIISKEKTMIIRGATGRKLPYGKVNTSDTLYLINNNGKGIVKVKVKVINVFNSEKMNKEASIKLVKNNQNKLKLTDKQFKKWGGKRYIVLIEINNSKIIPSFKIDKSKYSNMDDWLPVININTVKI